MLRVLLNAGLKVGRPGVFFGLTVLLDTSQLVGAQHMCLCLVLGDPPISHFTGGDAPRTMGIFRTEYTSCID